MPAASQKTSKKSHKFTNSLLTAQIDSKDHKLTSTSLLASTFNVLCVNNVFQFSFSYRLRCCLADIWLSFGEHPQPTHELVLPRQTPGKFHIWKIRHRSCLLLFTLLFLRLQLPRGLARTSFATVTRTVFWQGGTDLRQSTHEQPRRRKQFGRHCLPFLSTQHIQNRRLWPPWILSLYFKVSFFLPSPFGVCLSHRMALIKGNAEEILSGNARLEEGASAWRIATAFLPPSLVRRIGTESKRDVQEEKEKTPNNTAKSLSHVYIYIYLYKYSKYSIIYIYIYIFQLFKSQKEQEFKTPKKRGS